jgi:prevent-host-death family protein
MATKEKTIPAAEFKAKCLRILDDLKPEGIVITKRGRPIARVLPATTADNQKLIGSMKGKIQIKGDLFSTGVHWNAESGYAHRGSRSRRRSQ